jgi:protein SCO1/2
MVRCPPSRALLAASLALVAVWTGGCREEFAGTVLEPRRAAPDVGALRMADQRGKAVVVTFGFASCPIVCPLTLQRMATAYEALGPDAARVTMAFATVDPERDTPARLREHLARFDARILPVRVEPAALPATLASYGAVATRSGDSFDHTAGLFVVDPQGRLRLHHRHDAPPEGLVADLRRLLAEPAPTAAGAPRSAQLQSGRSPTASISAGSR